MDLSRVTTAANREAGHRHEPFFVDCTLGAGKYLVQARCHSSVSCEPNSPRSAFLNWPILTPIPAYGSNGSFPEGNHWPIDITLAKGAP